MKTSDSVGIRIRLGAVLGFALDHDERVWEMVRETVSTFKAERYLNCTELFLTYDNVVVQVRRPTGITIGTAAVGNRRLYMESVIIPDHPLLGEADPIPTNSQNNVALATNWVPS